MSSYINNNILLYIITAYVIFYLYYIRKNILALVFISLFSFLFVFIPWIVILFDRQDILFAKQSIILSFIFIIGFTITNLMFKTKNNNTNDLFYNNLINVEKYSQLSGYLILLGIILKIIGGDIVHSSIIKIPWSFSFLYGISDRIYYFGVMLTVLNIYFFGFKGKYKLILFTIIFLGFFGGSRVTILLPLSFMLILHISLNGAKAMLKMAIVGFLILTFIIVAVGLYRIDATDRIFTSDELIDLFLFRISEFYWPTSLIEKIDNGIVSKNPFWIISGLWGLFPSSISEFITGHSIFSRDTDIMFDSGLGTITMSVPMTPIGEGYYWFGEFGVFLIGSFFGFGFSIISIFLKKLNPLISILVIIQLYRLSFTLPVAAYSEFISFITKDILFSTILSFILIKVFRSLINEKYKLNKL